jgi:excisionase family DNA binding protein
VSAALKLAPKYLRVSEAAERLSVSKSFIRSLIAEGFLPAVRATVAGRDATKAPLLIDERDLADLASKFERVRRSAGTR